MRHETGWAQCNSGHVGGHDNQFLKTHPHFKCESVAAALAA
jgi:hypothetical protein